MMPLVVALEFHMCFLTHFIHADRFQGHIEGVFQAPMACRCLIESTYSVLCKCMLLGGSWAANKSRVNAVERARRYHLGGAAAAAADDAQLGGGGVPTVSRPLPAAAGTTDPGRFQRWRHEPGWRLARGHALLPWSRRPCCAGEGSRGSTAAGTSLVTKQSSGLFAFARSMQSARNEIEQVWSCRCTGAFWSEDWGSAGVSGSGEAGAGPGIWQLPVPAAQSLPPAAAGQPHALLWCGPPTCSLLNLSQVSLLHSVNPCLSCLAWHLHFPAQY